MISNGYLKGEKLLWWELDKIAVRESAVGGNMDMSNAATVLMPFLERPTHDECRRQFDYEARKQTGGEARRK